MILLLIIDTVLKRYYAVSHQRHKKGTKIMTNQKLENYKLKLEQELLALGVPAATADYLAGDEGYQYFANKCPVKKAAKEIKKFKAYLIEE